MDPVGYELRTTTDGKGDGVRATRCFDIGETVMVGVIERRVDRNDSHATQVSRTEWVRHGGLGSKVNHSCSPNCGVRLNDSGACDFVAPRADRGGRRDHLRLCHAELLGRALSGRLPLWLGYMSWFDNRLEGSLRRAKGGLPGAGRPLPARD